jgi:hypothetical protein
MFCGILVLVILLSHDGVSITMVRKKKPPSDDSALTSEDAVIGAIGVENANTLRELGDFGTQINMGKSMKSESWVSARPDVEAIIAVRRSCPHCQTWLASNHHETVMRYLWLKHVRTRVLDLDSAVMPAELVKYDLERQGLLSIHTPAIVFRVGCRHHVVEIDSDTLQKSPKLLFYQIQQAIEGTVEAPQYISVMLTPYRRYAKGHDKKPIDCWGGVVEKAGMGGSVTTIAHSMPQSTSQGGVSPCVVQPRC